MASRSLNKITLIGNLTRDPEYKQQSSGQSLCKLGIASNRKFKNKQTGMMIEEVCYIDVDVWGSQADSCRQYLQKGRPILVEGRLKLDSWEAEGQTKRKHSIVAERIVFLNSNNQAETSADEASISPATSTKKANFKSDSLKDDINFKDEQPFQDDLPF